MYLCALNLQIFDLGPPNACVWACKNSMNFYGCKSLKKSQIFLCHEKCKAFFSGYDLQTFENLSLQKSSIFERFFKCSENALHFLQYSKIF